MEENKQQTIEELVACIEDRKKNPKEGSYTDYLFTKGLDKILKKVMVIFATFFKALSFFTA